MRSTRVIRFPAAGPVALFLAMLLTAPDLAAQAAATMDAAAFPDNTVVVRLGVDEDALAGAGTSGELVAALREHLAIDLAMPLDEPLTVFLRGSAGDRAGPAPGFNFGYCALSLRHAVPDPLEAASYANLLQESHPDDEFCMDEDAWDEEAEWARLTEALEVGLAQSSDAFDPPPEPGHLPLRVASVHSVDTTDWDLLESLQGPLLELQPEPGFASSRDMNWERPEGFGYDMRLLVIQLEPVGPHSE
ncbi:MAG TPA: hypothetical protein VMM35_12985 [Longimicrobiales bacterium]|nr:hypothetical protein [Longimicrobiales bacterium]